MKKFDGERPRPTRQLDAFEWIGALAPSGIVGVASSAGAVATITWTIYALRQPARDQPELLFVAAAVGLASLAGMLYTFVLLRRALSREK